jgi:hypothetical protein
LPKLINWLALDEYMASCAKELHVLHVEQSSKHKQMGNHPVAIDLCWHIVLDCACIGHCFAPEIALFAGVGVSMHHAVCALEEGMVHSLRGTILLR